MSEPWHGTAGGYSNHKCRCDRCRTAWAAMCRQMKANRKARLAGDRGSTVRSVAKDAPSEHGTESTYTNWGCRCADCTEAHRIFNAR